MSYDMYNVYSMIKGLAWWIVSCGECLRSMPGEPAPQGSERALKSPSLRALLGVFHRGAGHVMGL